MTAQIEKLRNTRPPMNQVITGLSMLFILLVVGGVVLTTMFPRSVVPASAPAVVFSGERAMVHLPIIAREPHPQGSPAQARVRDYLVEQLSALGVEIEIQRSGSCLGIQAMP